MNRPPRTLLSALLAPLFLGCGGDQGPAVTPAQPTAISATATTAPSAAPPKALPYPETAKRPVTNEYHGVKVDDPYQWLEAPKDPEVERWIEAQNKVTRAYFDALPARRVLRDRVKAIFGAITATWSGPMQHGGKLFVFKWQPPQQQPVLVTQKSADDVASERVLVDPNVIDATGRTTIDWAEPSPDGKKVAVSLSVGGTENGTVHVYDTETGKETGDVVPYANSGTAGGSLSWASDSKGFHYTRHPHAGERKPEDMGFFQQVYFHKLGTKAADDTYALGKDFPRIAEIELKTSENGKFVLASVQNGDGGEFWHYLRDAKGTWARFADIPDKITEGDFGPDGKLYLISTKGAPRGKVLRVDPAKVDLAKAEVLVPESEVTIESVTPTKTKLYVVDLAGGPSQIRVFDLKGKQEENVPILPVSSTYKPAVLGGDDLIFSNTSFTEPGALYVYRAKEKKVTKTPLASKAPVSFDDAEVVRETCTSKDGTKVPINIVRKKGAKLDGSGAALLTGYGGYGVSQKPGMRPLARLLLDRGSAYAVANLRGGGEFGEAWHLAGNLTRKQNVFDDFYACAKHLVDSGHTRPERLAIMGGSNGGLLMGAALTQHPEMYRAVVSMVGIYDMLRVELSPNGAFNVTEFGSVKDPAQFKALLAYSPLHNVKDGVKYPSVLFTTGADDPRVEAWQSRKMVARLQAATSGGPVMLRASSGGHGGGTPFDEQIEQVSDVYSFLFRELGIEDQESSKQ
ncbi:prolyl oligopeptidase family serine peptidase [Chondromyces apiculatus]|uniref:prolyl oligopeptidase n=1 Tax=Chondromyces apiculatus DSM 436 TaxID=1192034 RepID=A0A017T092_9BACT|nr:prolyl oligopeptidase family serine peptidase [Chondromyces apiculatus]EYF02623.1 Prolyl endopeptidase [Chondromyces apiculatus DSM 436]